MIFHFKKFLIRLAINFLQNNNYEVCSKETGIEEVKKRKWFRAKKLNEKEKLLLMQIFEE